MLYCLNFFVLEIIIIVIVVVFGILKSGIGYLCIVLFCEVDVILEVENDGIVKFVIVLLWLFIIYIFFIGFFIWYWRGWFIKNFFGGVVCCIFLIFMFRIYGLIVIFNIFCIEYVCYFIFRFIFMKMLYKYFWVI